MANFAYFNTDTDEYNVFIGSDPEMVAPWVSVPMRPSADHTINVTTDGWDAPAPPTLGELKTTKQDALAAKRWLVEYSGFTISGGLLDGTFVDTSAKTRMVFDTAHRRATENPLYEIRAFKSGRGSFAMMNAATIILIGDAIEEFIQQCFEHESNLNDLVVAAVDQEGLDAIDIDAGWPT